LFRKRLRKLYDQKKKFKMMEYLTKKFLAATLQSEDLYFLL